MRIAALDMGGTAIKHGIWNGADLIGCEEAPSAARKGGPALLEQALAILRAMQPFDAIGVSTAGEVDTHTGIVLSANDNIPGYEGMNIAATLHGTFGVPVAVENDANAAAIGEMHHGIMKGQLDFLYVTYGTGVGGAIMTNGVLYHGKAFSAGSFGGIVVHPEKLDTAHLLSGRYETCASTSALIRNVQRVAPQLESGRAILAERNNPAVQATIDAWVREIAIGLATLIYSFSPPFIVLGGGIMQQPELVDSINLEVKKLVEPRFQGTGIVKSKLGNTAGVIGAAHLAQQLLSEPA